MKVVADHEGVSKRKVMYVHHTSGKFWAIHSNPYITTDALVSW
jgi:hypothetical protein